MSNLVGSTLPRLHTHIDAVPTPETSKGFAVVEFAESIGITLYPWQRWLLIHALATNPDGSLRYQKVCTLVARQAGKTTLLAVLSLFRLVRGSGMVLSSSASRDVALESLYKAHEIAEAHPDVFGPVKLIRRSGNESLTLLDTGAKWKIIARKGGRGLTAQLVVIDELREHHDFAGIASLESTTLTVPDSQVWLISNQGDYESVPLNRYREIGIAGTDESMFYAEWSAPDGSDVTDVNGWVAANPSLGYPGGVTETGLRSLMKSQPSAVFKTENLCMAVPNLDAVISPEAWQSCRDPLPFSAEARQRLVAGIEVSDGQISLVAAAQLPDGRVRVKRRQSWTSTTAFRRELPGVLDAIRPLSLGWFPESAGMIALDLKAVPINVELTGRDVTTACAEVRDLVGQGRLVHDGDPHLTEQVVKARKQKHAEAWKFSRSHGHYDALYAACAAVYLARRIEAPPADLRMRLAPE